MFLVSGFPDVSTHKRQILVSDLVSGFNESSQVKVDHHMYSTRHKLVNNRLRGNYVMWFLDDPHIPKIDTNI